MEISEYPQLFLDDVSVARMVNLRRELQAPVKHPGNPLIVQDKPWEKRMLNFYGTVLYEPDRKKFRCWYLAREEDGSIVDRPEGPITAEYLQCYAESDDGLRWTKPPVGWEKFGAYDGHNVLIYSGHGLCVLREPDDSDPAKCYKGAGGPFFGFSPDGLRWTVRDWKSAVGKNDTGTSVVRWKGEYLAFVRNQAQWEGGVLREVGLTTSRDFETWTPKTAVFKTDDIDGSPWVQPYGLSVTAWGDCLIGILWVFHLDKIPGQNRLGYIDTQLVTSRDGRSWTRVADRATFLTPTPGAWDRAGTWAGTTMFVKDDRV